MLVQDQTIWEEKRKVVIPESAGSPAGQVTGSGRGFCASVTLNVFIPGLPVGQVHVDVGTQLRAAAAEEAEDFVLVKSRFLPRDKHC